MPKLNRTPLPAPQRPDVIRRRRLPATANRHRRESRGAAGNITAVDELEWFIDLANRGRGQLGGSGALAARRLALVILSNVPALDGRALAGLARFIDAAKYIPETARGSIR